MKSISDKQRAKRVANGEHFISSTIARKSEKIVSRGAPPKARKPRKEIPRKNEERQQRLSVIRRQKHAAYRRSECYKAVEKRSGGRCERMVSVVVLGGGFYPNVGAKLRCENERSDGLKMTHNHKTYARYGGKELPEDMELLCPSCNSAYESQKRGNRRFLGAGARDGE